MKKRLRGLLALCIVAAMALVGTTAVASAATNWRVDGKSNGQTQELLPGDTISKGSSGGDYRIFVNNTIVSPKDPTSKPGYTDQDITNNAPDIYFNDFNMNYTISANTEGYYGWQGTASTSQYYTEGGGLKGLDITLSEIPIPYTIQYNANGGTGSVDNSSFDVKGAYKFSDGNGLTKDGMNVKRWNIKADGSGTNYALGADIPDAVIDLANEDHVITLYAQYKDIDASPATTDPMNIGVLVLMMIGTAGIGMAAIRRRAVQK
ncbi:MAG: hypothetical protein GX663_04770 [Clostridiales bacterium]|nr:hypothetical protein [Clostridiales bacterium]